MADSYNVVKQLEDDICELKQLNALVGFMQTAFAEGSDAVTTDDTAGALYHVYISQFEILRRMQGRIDGVEKHKEARV